VDPEEARAGDDVSPLAFALALCLLGSDRAVVALSNGERAEGRFSLGEGKKLEVFDTRLKTKVSIDPSEVARITVTVESEKIEQGWMWKEEGDHDKVKLPFHYPLRKLETAVTLVSGEVVRGHVTSVFYLETEADDGDGRRFFLLADQKGEKEQKLEDLVYVKEVVLPERAVGNAKLLTFKTKVPAAAVSLDRDASFEAPLAGLLSGKYDLYLFPKEAPAADAPAAKVRYGLTGTPLDAASREKVEKTVAATEEFFTKKLLAAATKDGEVVRVLLELSRVEPTSDDPKKGYVRWELWTLEAKGEGFDVKKRLYLHRLRFDKERGTPRFEYVAEEKLKGAHEGAEFE
jgi:hypothetical protein